MFFIQKTRRRVYKYVKNQSDKSLTIKFLRDIIKSVEIPHMRRFGNCYDIHFFRFIFLLLLILYIRRNQVRAFVLEILF